MAIVRPSISLAPEDFLCLEGENLLTGRVINAYLRLIERRSAYFSHFPKVLSLDTEFLPAWHRGGYQATRNRVGSVDPFSMDMVLFPLHLPQVKPQGHWSLVVAKPKAKQILAYDSCGVSRLQEMSVVREFLEAAASEDVRPDFLGGWTIRETHPRCPRQQDGVSCGVFLCVFADKTARVSRLYDTKVDVKKARKTIAEILRRGKFDREDFTELDDFDQPRFLPPPSPLPEAIISIDDEEPVEDPLLDEFSRVLGSLNEDSTQVSQSFQPEEQVNITCWDPSAPTTPLFGDFPLVPLAIDASELTEAPTREPEPAGDMNLPSNPDDSVEPMEVETVSGNVSKRATQEEELVRVKSMSPCLSVTLSVPEDRSSLDEAQRVENPVNDRVEAANGIGYPTEESPWRTIDSDRRRPNSKGSRPQSRRQDDRRTGRTPVRHCRSRERRSNRPDRPRTRVFEPERARDRHGRRTNQPHSVDYERRVIGNRMAPAARPPRRETKSDQRDRPRTRVVEPERTRDRRRRRSDQPRSLDDERTVITNWMDPTPQTIRPQD